MLSWSDHAATIEFKLTPDDLRAFVRFTMLGMPRGRAVMWIGRAVMIGAQIAGVFMIAGMGDDPRRWLLLIPTPVALVLAWWVPYWGTLAMARISAEHQIANTKGLGEWTFTADGEGLSHAHRAGTGWVPWSAVHSVESPPSGVYVFTQPLNAHVIPSHAFADAEEMESFARFCRERVEQQITAERPTTLQAR